MVKTRLLIFGAGKNAEKIINCLRSETEIIAFADNDGSKWGSELFGKKVIAPEMITGHEYEFIVIAVMDCQAVSRQLAGYGINEKRIIAPFLYDHKQYEGWRGIFNIEELIYLEMNQKIESLTIYIENLEYELAAKIRDGRIKYPKILNWEKAVEEIVQNRKSMSRFGDGEFDLMLDRHNSFQKCDDDLKARLQEVLCSRLPNHIVGIPDVYGYFENRTSEFMDCFRNHLKDGRRQREYAMLDMEKEYYDSFITRPYKDFADKAQAAAKFALLKTIWRGRDITIVEGQKTRLGAGNDLFCEAKSCIRILGPCTDAWSRYGEILDAVLKTDRDRLVLIALGPTATVLAYDLAQKGYQALDIGHVDIEYEWFLRGVEKMVAIEGKYTNEVPGGRNVQDGLADETYENEIIGRIG